MSISSKEYFSLGSPPPSPEQLARMDQINNQSELAGQYAMVAVRQVKTQRRSDGCYGGGDRVRLGTEYAIGVLADEPPFVTTEFDTYAQINTSRHMNVDQFREDLIRADFVNNRAIGASFGQGTLMVLGQWDRSVHELNPQLQPYVEDAKAFEMVFGNRAVGEYIEGQRWSRRGILAFKVQRAFSLEMKGMPATLRALMDGEVEQEKQLILEKLVQLESEFDLNRAVIAKIDRETRLPRVSFGFEPDYERMVGQDEKELKNILKIPKGQREKELVRDMKPVIEEAYYYEMDKDGERRQELVPGRWISTDVPRYLQAYRERFEIA